MTEVHPTGDSRDPKAVLEQPGDLFGLAPVAERSERGAEQFLFAMLGMDVSAYRIALATSCGAISSNP
jgi:hypothetical protein